jgi:transposase
MLSEIRPVSSDGRSSRRDPAGGGLISRLSLESLLARKHYGSDRLRASIADGGAEAIIPSNRSRSRAPLYNKDLYKERNLAVRSSKNIKHYRRIATCYDKTVSSSASCSKIWLK